MDDKTMTDQEIQDIKNALLTLNNNEWLPGTTPNGKPCSCGCFKKVKRVGFFRRLVSGLSRVYWRLRGRKEVWIVACSCYGKNAIAD